MFNKPSLIFLIILIFIAVSICSAAPIKHKRNGKETRMTDRNQYLLEQEMVKILEEAMSQLKTIAKEDKKQSPVSISESLKTLECLLLMQNC